MAEDADKNKDKKYILEWSHKQKQFHIHTFEDMIRKNLQACITSKDTVYVPIGIFDTRKEADQFSLQLEKKLK